MVSPVLRRMRRTRRMDRPGVIHRGVGHNDRRRSRSYNDRGRSYNDRSRSCRSRSHNDRGRGHNDRFRLEYTAYQIDDPVGKLKPFVAVMAVMAGKSTRSDAQYCYCQYNFYLSIHLKNHL